MNHYTIRQLYEMGAPSGALKNQEVCIVKRIVYFPLGIFYPVVVGLIAGAAFTVRAVDYNYIQTSGTSLWTTSANWHQPNDQFPGDTPAQSDNAYVNQSAAGDYTVLLDQTLPGILNVLRIDNPFAGKATVAMSAPQTIGNQTTLATNGRLVIDGVAVTGGGLYFMSGSELVLNNGGSRVTANATQYIAENLSGTTNFLTSTQSPAGLLNMQNSTLRIGTGAAFGNNLFRVDNGVVMTNINLQVGWAGYGNAVVIDNATFFSSHHINLGDGGGSGGLLLLDNGAVVHANYSGGRSLVTGNNVRDNRVVITNGARLYTYGDGLLGNGGTNNSITVTGEGSLFDMGRKSIRVGGYNNNLPAGNALHILNGGVVTNAVGLQIHNDAGPGFNNKLIVDNGKLYGENFLIAPNGRGCLFEVKGKNALVAGPGVSTGITFAQRKNGGHYFTGASNNVMRVSNGGTISNFVVSVAIDGANMVSNRLEVTNGGRIFMNVGNGRLSLAAAVSNAWGNVATFSGGSLLEAKEIYINASATGPVRDNYISFEDSVLQFPQHNPGITLTGDAYITFKNSTISYRGVTQDGGGIDVANMNGNVAKMTFVGDTALRLSGSRNRSDANATYVFDKGLGANHYYRLDLMDGPTLYRSNNNAAHTLTFGAQGELFCSNTTATVSLATTVNGKMTVLDSEVLFERGLVLNGDLFINTDATANGPVIINVMGDLELGPASRIFINGKSESDVLINYSGDLRGRFAQKLCLDASYAIGYGTGNDSAIGLHYAPPGTLFMLR